jgi:uncharacterized protein with PQ loop repeat
MHIWDNISFWAAVALPFWDIPLILRIIRRKSAADISLVWMWGIWATSVMMAPSAFMSGEKSAIGFNIVNVVMLTILLIVVIKYQKGKE